MANKSARRAAFLVYMVRRLNILLKPYGYTCVPEKKAADFYLHAYKSYAEYKEIQVLHNLRKLDEVWADKVTLDRVAAILSDRFPARPIRGLCHGARNGFEQNYLRSLPLGIDAIGTDISETATRFENSIQWDFHDRRTDWVGAFDFVYTNSLDQSWQPKEALRTWLEQLHRNGVLIIEHTEVHGPAHASEMDPFGVRPTAMPYVLTMWFGAQISVSHSVAPKQNKRRDAWLFVVSKNVDTVVAL